MPRPPLHRRNKALALAALLLLAGCGGGSEADTVRDSNGDTGPVAAKAVADVDAAMADAAGGNAAATIPEPAPAQPARP